MIRNFSVKIYVLAYMFLVGRGVPAEPAFIQRLSRRLRPTFILCMLAGVLLAGCRPAPAPKDAAFKPIVPGILDADNALAEARALVVLGPRDAGTPGARQAA